jgi:hypothetical protein
MSPEDITKQTYYYPATDEDTEAAGLDPSIEGGTQGSGPFKNLDLRNHTLEAYRREESPFVAVAMKDVPYGTQFPLKLHGSNEVVPAKVVDTGGGLASGTHVDIATENPQLAKTGGGKISPPPESAPGDQQVPLDLPSLDQISAGGIPDVTAAGQDTGDAIRAAIDATPARALVAGDNTDAADEYASTDTSDEPTTTEMSSETPVAAAQPQEQEGAPTLGRLGKIPQVDHVDADKGLIYYKNGMILDTNSKDIYTTDPAGNQWLHPADGSKPVKIKGAAGAIHPAIMNQLIANGAPVTNPDGSPYQNDAQAAQALQDFQKANGIPTKVQQHIADMVTNKLGSSRNPYTKNYLAMQGNYESAMDNIDKQGRNGIDDAFLLSAIAGIENPGRSNTENDFRVALRSAGIRGNIEVMAKRASAIFNGSTQDQGRILPDEMLPQIKGAVTNAVKARYNLYQAGVEPFRRQLANAGLNPDNYIPPIKLRGGAAVPPAPSAAFPNQPPPTISSQSEYNQLPPGKYQAIGSDGQLHTFTKAK